MPIHFTTLFDLAGGHPALDLVNSLDNRYRADGPHEMLAGFSELVRFLQESGLITTVQAQLLKEEANPQAAERAMISVRQLREASAAVFYAVAAGEVPPAADLKMLERFFLEADRHRQLTWENGPGWKWTSDESNPELSVWILSRSVCELLFCEQLALIRTCDADTCRWLFLDTSKNHTRRWCNMRVCGNRMKARRFQARRAD